MPRPLLKERESFLVLDEISLIKARIIYHCVRVVSVLFLMS